MQGITRRVVPSVRAAARKISSSSPHSPSPSPSPSPFVCSSCLAQAHARRRAFSGTSARATAPAAPPASGYAALGSRRLLSVSGPDAARFLQGIVTASVVDPADGRRPRPGPGLYTAFLTAQGRVLHDVHVYPDALGADDGFLVEVDAAEAERLARHIKRYRLRARFDVRFLDQDEFPVWHVWDDAGRAGLGPGGLRSGGSGGSGEPVVWMEDRRAPGMGYRAVFAAGQAPEVPGLERADEEAYRVRRYLLGVAEGQQEMVREQALPQESNLDAAGAIDFRKGCYVGQELTIRTRHRGVVRKRILPCALYDAGEDAPSQLAYRPDEGGGAGPRVAAEAVPRDTSIGRAGRRGRSAGRWLRGVGNVGLALCRLEIMTDVALPGEAASAAFDPADEFVLQWENDGGATAVKVKAFVPDWLRAELDGTR